MTDLVTDLTDEDIRTTFTASDVPAQAGDDDATDPGDATDGDDDGTDADDDATDGDADGTDA
jgi:hypothetical protein